MAYNRMRSERSRELETYYEQEERQCLQAKSFAERWEEREVKRRHTAVEGFKANRAMQRNKKKLSAEVEKTLAEISDVIHGFNKGTFHGTTPGSSGDRRDPTSASAAPGLEFPAQVP